MKRVQILLVEDNRADVLLVREALDQAGIAYELHLASDGAEALQFVTHMGKPEGPPCPDVILLDLNLPKADGPQVLSAFRQHPECTHTPVIVVSSSGAARDQAQMQGLGVSHYFRKSSDFEEFMQLGAVVRRVIESL